MKWALKIIKTRLFLKCTRESRGAKAPFAKYNEEERSGRCILLQLCGEIHNKGKEINYPGNRNTSDRENEKTERKYTIGETRT